MLAALDPLRELDLLRRRQQVDPSDVLEEQLQRIGRRLERASLDLHLVLRARRRDDLDLLLLERLEDVGELAGLEIEVVEGERDLLGGQRAAFPSGLEQRPRLVRLENVVNALRCCLNLAQRSPTPLVGF